MTSEYFFCHKDGQYQFVICGEYLLYREKKCPKINVINLKHFIGEYYDESNRRKIDTKENKIFK